MKGKKSLSMVAVLCATVLRPRTALILILMGLNLVSALSVVYIKNENRLAFVALSQLKKQRVALQAEWMQLLLEKSTWGAYGRIESTVQGWGMHSPKTIEVIKISPWEKKTNA